MHDLTMDFRHALSLEILQSRYLVSPHIVSGAPARAPSHHSDKYSLQLSLAKYDWAKNYKAANFTFSLKDHWFDLKAL